MDVIQTYTSKYYFHSNDQTTKKSQRTQPNIKVTLRGTSTTHGTDSVDGLTDYVSAEH